MQVLDSKKKLLSAIEKCEKNICFLIKDDNKKKIFDAGVEKIKNTLAWCPKNIKFPDFSSLKFESDFEDFVGQSKADKLVARLDLICHDLTELGNNIKDYLIKSAISEMRKSKKGTYIAVIVLLGIFAILASTLGIFSAIGKIDSAWGNIIGTLDCAFGILFFAYELYDDKVKESAIACEDAQVIEKYTANNKDVREFLTQESIIDSSNSTSENNETSSKDGSKKENSDDIQKVIYGLFKKNQTPIPHVEDEIRQLLSDRRLSSEFPKSERSQYKLPVEELIKEEKILLVNDERIEADKYHGRFELLEIILGPNVKAIGNNAFFGGKRLIRVFISKNVQEIGVNAFADCAKYLKIYCEANEQPQNWNENWNPDHCEVVWNATLNSFYKKFFE